MGSSKLIRGYRVGGNREAERACLPLMVGAKIHCVTTQNKAIFYAYDLGNKRLSLPWAFVFFQKEVLFFVRLINFPNSEFLARKSKFNYSLLVYLISLEQKLGCYNDRTFEKTSKLWLIILADERNYSVLFLSQSVPFHAFRPRHSFVGLTSFLSTSPSV
jgi:hypothetical protein